MIEIRLGDYVKIKTGKLNANAQDENGEYPFFTCAKVISRINTYAYDCECVLVAGNGVLNAKYYNGKFNAYQRVYIIEVKNREELSTRFLYYFIDKYMEKLRDGSIGGIIQYIKLNHLTDITLSLPDLTTQNKIVALLDKVSALVQKRENSIDLLDELLRAQFLDMFGDPVLNTKGWEINKFKNISTGIESGWSPVCNDISRQNSDEWAILKQGAVSRRVFIPTENKQLPEGKEIKKEVVASKGDVLFSRKNSAHFVGATAYVFDEYQKLLLPDTIFKLLLKLNVVRPLYIYQLFNDDNFRLEIQNLKNGAASSMPNISKVKLNNLKLPIPPIELQNQFETIYHNIQAQKETLKQSKTELENLYNSLLKRAFKGEIEVPKEDVKKKDWIMPEIKKKEGEKVDITKLDLATFLGIPDEITSVQEKWMFDLISLDEFYQFLLKDTFKKEEAFTLGDIEEKLHDFFYRIGDMDFDNSSWQKIIFKFLEAKPPLLEQIFDRETATVKLKLTDETFKA